MFQSQLHVKIKATRYKNHSMGEYSIVAVDNNKERSTCNKGQCVLGQKRSQQLE